MTEHRRLRTAGLGVVSVAILSGCSTSGGTAPARPANSAVASGPRAATAYTAEQLKNALLSKLAGRAPAIPVEAGQYGSLQGVQATKQTLQGVRISPSKCAKAARTGLDATAFAQVPGTVVTFRSGSGGGISEVLLAPPAEMMGVALGHKVAPDCLHYRATVGGRTFTYTVKDEPAPRLGNAAREVNVHAAGGVSADIWTVIYRSRGYVGAVTLVGQGVTRKDVESIAKLAYSKAEQKLH